MIRIDAHSVTMADTWDAYVRTHGEASSYHLWGWRDILAGSLGHTPHYLSARRNGRVCGVLPLVCLSRPVLGKILVSLPFVSYGGILADDAETGQRLLDAALELARELDAKRIELRHQRQDVAALPAKVHRVSMVLPLPESIDVLWKRIGVKLRNQVRKADRSGLTVSRAGLEELPAFYRVFARNMRDLGSPVWPRSFFRRILETFPDRARLYRVDLGDLPVAAGLTFRFRQTVEIPWASSLRDYNHLCANVRLYWQILADAVLEGYERFDFGRSAPDSGTYRFKEQWGAREQLLYWHHWPEERPGGGLESRRELLEHAWSRLPVWTTRLIGPPVRRWLPQ